MPTEWKDKLDEMKCSQIIIILKNDISYSDARRMIETLMMIDGIQAAIPNTVERHRYDDQ